MQALTLEIILRAVFGLGEGERLVRSESSCGACWTGDQPAP